MTSPILNTNLSDFISRMNITNLEIPSTKQEEWRFTDLNFLKNKQYNSTNSLKTDSLNNKSKSNQKNQIHIINNITKNRLKDINSINGLDILNMNSALKKYPQIFKNYFSKIYPYKNDYFCSQNLLNINDGIFILIKKNADIKFPLECIFSTLGIDLKIMPRIFIYCSSNSNFSFIEKYISNNNSNSYTNVITEIYLEENSNIEYLKLQSESKSSTHFSGLGIYQEKNSSINCHTLTKETGFTRNNIFSKLNGQGSECKLNGLSIGSDTNFIDNHSIIQHSAPHSISSELYKGIYSDSSKGVFDAKVIVDDNASKIDSEQLNNNILLSKGASVHSNPRLEINTDDVSCKHGSTTGQLENEPLFYIRSRGFSIQDAQKILLNGFCSEFIDNMANPEIRNSCSDIIKKYITNV